MARTSETGPLWKKTASTNLKKHELIDLANAKEDRIIQLRRKNSKFDTFNTTNLPRQLN